MDDIKDSGKLKELRAFTIKYNTESMIMTGANLWDPRNRDYSYTEPEFYEARSLNEIGIDDPFLDGRIELLSETDSGTRLSDKAMEHIMKECLEHHDDPLDSVETSDTIRCQLSPEAQNLEGFEGTEFYHEGMSRLNEQRSELTRLIREIDESPDATDRMNERVVLEERLKQNEFDLERLNGSGAPAPYRDLTYKDMSELEPGDYCVLRKGDLWESDIGNSKMRSDDESVNDILKKYGQDGVEYRNNNPDFRPFTKHYDEYLGYFDGEVAIIDMKGDVDSFGNRINARKFNETGVPGENGLNMCDLGNYAQGDLALSKRLNTSPDVIKSYRESNRLTWHECRDGITMQLIPTEINAYFKHQGGTSMMRELNTSGNVIRGFDKLRTKRS